jgi:hypothetical protein
MGESRPRLSRWKASPESWRAPDSSPASDMGTVDSTPCEVGRTCVGLGSGHYHRPCDYSHPLGPPATRAPLVDQSAKATRKPLTAPQRPAAAPPCQPARRRTEGARRGPRPYGNRDPIHSRCTWRQGRRTRPYHSAARRGGHDGECAPADDTEDAELSVDEESEKAEPMPEAAPEEDELCSRPERPTRH